MKKGPEDRRTAKAGRGVAKAGRGVGLCVIGGGDRNMIRRGLWVMRQVEQLTAWRRHIQRRGRKLMDPGISRGV